jgi:NodT family efflux transporter outer membrane factor (OMF) lipoprotein
MKLRAAKFGAGVLTALLVASCADMGGISTRATLESADTLAAGRSLGDAKLSPGAWPPIDWWKEFRDAQLDRLIAEALAGSPTLAVARARVRSALAVARTARSALYPEVKGDVTLTRERLSEHGLVPPPFGGRWITEAGLQATFDYGLDLWGRHRAAYESAVGRARAVEVEDFAARLALSVAVAQAYVQLQQVFLQLDLARKTLAEEQQIYQLTRDRFDAGIDTRLAVKQAEAALPATRLRILRLRETRDVTRHALAALMGRGPDRGLEIGRPHIKTLPEVRIPSKVPAALLGRRPDIVAQRWRVEAAARDIDVAKARFYPDVNLAAFIGLQSVGLSNLLEGASRTLGAGPAITLPIFEGGRLRADLARRSADYDAAVERYKQTLVEALHDVVDHLTSLRSLEEQRSEQKRAEANAREAFDLALMRFREGVGNYLEVLTAESRLLEQRAIDIDLHTRALNLSIGLTRALGGGFDDDSAPRQHRATENEFRGDAS